VCAEGGAHLPIAHTLHLQEPTNKNKSEGGSITPFFCTNPLVGVKLGYPPNFNFLGHLEVPLKYVHGRKRKNNAKFSGHYVRPRMHNVRTHALRSHQNVY